MKKILAILAIIMFLPFAAYGLEMIHDDAMDEISGQMGITVDVYGLGMDLALGLIFMVDVDGWGNTDTILGNEDYDNPGVTFPIGRIFDTTRPGTMIDDVSVSVLGLTIDCAQSTDTTGASDAVYANLPFLRIGLGDIAISTGQITTSFSGDVYIASVNLVIDGGLIDIGSSVAQLGNGLTIRITDLALPVIAIGTLSWGDMNGFAAPPGTDHLNPGYVGLNGGISISDLDNLDGVISIDCGDDASATMGSTILRIGIAQMDISMGAIWLTPSLGPTQDLGQDLITLGIGSVAITGMGATIDISAH